MKFRFTLILMGAIFAVAALPLPHSRLHASAVARELPYMPVSTPNGNTLSFTMEKGIKVFRLTVEVIQHEMAPGMVINAWGYNGQTPGPTIEAVEGDRVKILVTNKLPEGTAVHWHGLILPSGMDGIQGLNQPSIKPGETFAYEFTLKQHGTQMYHSHGDEMVQMGMGSMGFFIIHPRHREKKIDRDYAIFLNEWFVAPGSKTPNPNVMTDFNIFTFNGKAYPGTAPLIAKTGERVRIRFGNVGQESHPIHLHGHSFKVVATDGGDIPASAQWPETTVSVFPGQSRDVEFIARAGDWALHCHRRHHPMNAMGHEAPNMLGVNQKGVEEKVRKHLPDYMAMGEKGMDDMSDMGMQGPANTLPMMGGDGPFGPVGMGGMFTILKVRDNWNGHGDPGWYPNPKGTVAYRVSGPADNAGGSDTSAGQGAHLHNQGTAVNHDASEDTVYSCPMHPEVRQTGPGKCPKCGMTLQPIQQAPDTKSTTEPSAVTPKSTTSPLQRADVKTEGYYTCPMHPEVHMSTPGKCPKCGMTLKFQEASAPPKE